MSMAAVEQLPLLDSIPEKDATLVHRTPMKEGTKNHTLEDCHSTDEGTFVSTSSCTSEADLSPAQGMDTEEATTPEPTSSCTSDDENCLGQEADVDSSRCSDSGLNSSCASDEEDISASALRSSDPIALAKLPSVGSVGHYAGQCSRCCFFPKGRCSNGASCNFCHLDHERVRRKRGGTVKKVAKAAEEAKNATDQQVPHDPVVKQLEFGEAMMTEEPAFTLRSLEAKGDAIVAKMQAMNARAKMHAVNTYANQPAAVLSYSSAMSYHDAPRPAPMQGAPAPQCPRSSAPAAELLASKLLAVSSGRPVKVALPPDVQPLKRLDASIPAKKKPSFPEYASDKQKKLDPNMPCKKHMPSCLLNLDTSPAAPKPKPQTSVPVPSAPVSSMDPTPR